MSEIDHLFADNTRDRSVRDLALESEQRVDEEQRVEG